MKTMLQLQDLAFSTLIATLHTQLKFDRTQPKRLAGTRQSRKGIVAFGYCSTYYLFYSV
jgi:hypothetical protein